MRLAGRLPGRRECHCWERPQNPVPSHTPSPSAHSWPGAARAPTKRALPLRPDETPHPRLGRPVRGTDRTALTRARNSRRHRGQQSPGPGGQQTFALCHLTFNLRHRAPTGVTRGGPASAESGKQRDLRPAAVSPPGPTPSPSPSPTVARDGDRERGPAAAAGCMMRLPRGGRGGRAAVRVAPGSVPRDGGWRPRRLRQGGERRPE